MTPRHIVMGVALVAAAALVAFGDKSPAPEVVEAVERAPARTAAAPASAPAVRGAGEPAILPLLPRAALIGDDDDLLGGGADVFGRRDWNPPPPVQQAVVQQAAPPPSAPPLPFTYLGKAAANGAWEVFLARGDQVYIVRANTVLEGTYRVDAIVPPNLTLTYLPLNQVQQLNIGVLD